MDRKHVTTFVFKEHVQTDAQETKHYFTVSDWENIYGMI